MNYHLFDSLLDGVLVLDSEKSIIYCNEVAKKLPLPKKLQQGQSFDHSFSIPILQNFFKQQKTDLTSQRSPYFEHEFYDSDGNLIILKISAQTQVNPTPPEKGQWVIFIRDVSIEQSLYKKYQFELKQKESTLKKLKETQDQLIQYGKAATTGEFLASITHELNNPLTYLLAASETLTDVLNYETINLEEAKKLTDHISKGAQKILKISSHLKTFFHGPLTPENLVPTDIYSIIEKAIHFTQHFTQKNKVSVTHDIPLCLPHVMMDPTLIEQIAINLIRNSVDALNETKRDEPQQIEIHAKYNDRSDCIIVTFVDHGPGMPQEVMNKLFTPFFTTKPIGTGTGLGLSLCAAIADKHGGTLTAKSTPGHGATFFLTLPIKTEDLAKAQALLQKDLKGLKILVVDDEPRIRSLQKSILSQLGCEIFEAGNGIEALEQCKTRRPDVTITDLAMDEMTGIEFAEKAKKLYQDMKIILLTGSVSLKNLGTNEDLFDEMVAKPFPNDSIRKAILNVMVGKSAQMV